ncbi:MAG: LolA-related protein [Burkholderiales bacterium]
MALVMMSANVYAFDVHELMDTLARVEKSDARFTETKHIALLDKPLVLSGTLSYARPDRLEKNVLSPQSERFVLDGNTLTIEAKGKRRTLTLEQQPLLRAFVESIRAARAGDLRALERHYQLDLTGSADAWTLTLKPNDSAARKHLKAIVLSGQNEHIVQVEIFETGGDRSIMVLNEKLS